MRVGDITSISRVCEEFGEKYRQWSNDGGSGLSRVLVILQMLRGDSCHTALAAFG